MDWVPRKYLHTTRFLSLIWYHKNAIEFSSTYSTRYFIETDSRIMQSLQRHVELRHVNHSPIRAMGSSRRSHGILVSSSSMDRNVSGESSKKPGDSLGSLVTSTENPLDLVSFVPRLTVGALFSTVEEGVRLAQSDIERISMILSDESMQSDEKQTQLLLEIEDRLAGFVEKGIEKENEVIDTLQRTVPEEIQGSLPDQVKEWLFEKRGVKAQGSGNGMPLATWTLSEDDVVVMNGSGRIEIDEYKEVDVEEEEYVPSPEVTARGQAAAELVDIQGSVMVLKENVAAFKSNTDESKNGMLKLNVREACQSLSQKIEQRSMSTKNSGNPDIDAALVEAKELLQEVNTLLL